MAAVYQIITLIASDLATQAEGATASVLSGRDRSDRSGQKRYTEERSERTFISGVNAERSFLLHFLSQSRNRANMVVAMDQY